jgi:nucleoid DNA-binding protein
MATKKKTAAKKTATKTAAKPAAKTATKTAAKTTATVTAKKSRKANKPKNDNTLSYTQSEFLENIQQFCGLNKKSEAKVLCEDISLFIQDSLKKGYKIPLLGLGKMYVRRTKPRVGRNPATGEQIKIPAKKRVRFTAAKALKSAVLV